MRVALNGLFLAAPATGTGQYLRELVRALRKVSPDDDFTFIAPRADATAPAPVLVLSTRLRRENLAKLEFEQLTFPRAARRAHVAIAHVPHFGSPLFSAVPTVVTIHDLIPVVLPAYRGSLRVRLYTRLAGWGARRASAVIADSHASARDIEQRLRIPREKIHVVPLAANPRYNPVTDPRELERVRAKYDLPKQFALYLGGFDVRKNVERVIAAFAALGAGPRAGWRLVLAGKLPERSTAFIPDPRAIASRFGISDVVQFTGFVEEADQPALYTAARVFLFPSIYEGFGLPPLEAMACGTPVICSNSSSLPEVVGDAGILLAPDNARAWGDALRWLLHDEAARGELCARALRQAEKFSWERAARETMTVYRSVV